MKIRSVFYAAIAASLIISCGDSKQVKGLTEGVSGDMETYENSDVNAIEQALPSIMIIPSDQVLQKFRMLTTENVNGREYVLRNYAGYLLKDSRAKYLFATIQDDFSANNFPLNDFEQTLKQLETQEANDIADGLVKDAKTQLLTIAQPDIILELNYDTNGDQTMSMFSHDYTKVANSKINYSLKAIDAYTNKVIASTAECELEGSSTIETIQQSLKELLPEFQNRISQYFSDILTRGRDITVRVVMEDGCALSLSDESIEGDTYADWIIDYIKGHTVKGAYKLQRNTDNELYFVNCRIKLLNEDGTQYGVYDWTRDLQKNLRKNLGLKCKNKAQGLGEVIISIEGIN